MPQHIQLYKGTDSLSQLPVRVDLTQPAEWLNDFSWIQADDSWQYFNLDSAIARTSGNGQTHENERVGFQFVPSLFETSLLKAEWREPMKIEQNNLLNTVLSVLFLAALVLAVILKLNAAPKISQLINSSFRPNNFRRFVEEYQPGWMPPVFTAYLLSLLVFSGIIIAWVFPLLQLSDRVKIGISFLFILAVVILPIIRSFILAIWGWIFSTRQLAMFHVQFSYVTLLYSGIFLTPFFLNYALNLGLEHWLSPAVMYIGLGCIWLYQLARIWMQGSSPDLFSVFYLFIYLCTLEIVPLLLIVKLIENIGRS